MAEIKISDLTPKGVNLAVTDLLVISEDIGGGLYETKSITGDEVLNAVAKTAVAVRNQTGATIYKGTIVYISGASGGKALISKAQANSEATSSKTLGVVTADIANNANGNVLTNGLLTALDTRTTAMNPFTADTLAIGDDLYLSPTNAGYVTNVKPIAPNNLVNIGKVLETSGTTGQILYAIVNGYELGELHDVDTTGAVSGNVLALNGGIWKPTTISTGLTIGTTPITSGTDTRILFQNGGVVSQNAMLTLNDTGVAGSTTANFANTFKRVGNNFEIYGANGVTNMISSEGGGTALNFISTFQNVHTAGNNHNFKIGTGAPVSVMYINSSLNVGIGTTSPAAKLDIKAQGALSTDIAFRVRNSADTATIGYIAGNGLILLGENASTAPTVIVNPGGSSRLLLRGGTNQDLTFSSSGFAVLNCAQGFDAVAGSAGSSIFRFRNGSGGNISLYYGGLQIGTLQTASTSTNFTLIANGVAPSVNYTDSHYYYSADIIAGNAAPHFKTEDGSVIKLYKQNLPTNPTNAELATFLSNLGLANLI